MSLSAFNQRLKPWMLPIAMVCGIFFHEPVNRVQWAVPYLIFTMLLITFCRVKPSDLRIDGMIWRLLAVQVAGTVATFLLLEPINLSLAQSIMICVLCPTATAAPVVTGMLGGSIGKVATYSIASNLTAAILAPAMFVWCGSAADVSFFTEFKIIALKVAPMIVFPLGLAWVLYFTAPKVHAIVADAQKITFYLWSVSLLLVVGKSVVLLLYRSGVRRAFWIDLLRILLNGFLFGNLYGILYSLAGGLLSFLVMAAAKETERFRFGLSVTGVSIAGGVFHNAGQIAVAAFVVETAGLYYYLPPLLAAGAGTGFLIGLVSERILITTWKKRDGL